MALKDLRRGSVRPARRPFVFFAMKSIFPGGAPHQCWSRQAVQKKTGNENLLFFGRRCNGRPAFLFGFNRPCSKGISRGSVSSESRDVLDQFASVRRCNSLDRDPFQGAGRGRFFDFTALVLLGSKVTGLHFEARSSNLMQPRTRRFLIGMVMGKKDLFGLKRRSGLLWRTVLKSCSLPCSNAFLRTDDLWGAH